MTQTTVRVSHGYHSDGYPTSPVKPDHRLRFDTLA